MKSSFGKDYTIKDKYNHSEAFCLMIYKCKECGFEEVLWNSRDGVTPFMINCIKCDGNSYHINWNKDIRRIGYVPKIGQRVFYSCKNIHELIQVYFDAFTEERWEKIKDSWNNYCKDRLELICKMARYNITEDLRFEQPHIAIITEENRYRFLTEIGRSLYAMQKMSEIGISAIAATGAMYSLAQAIKIIALKEEEELKQNRYDLKAPLESQLDNIVIDEFEKLQSELNKYKDKIENRTKKKRSFYNFKKQKPKRKTNFKSNMKKFNKNFNIRRI